VLSAWIIPSAKTHIPTGCGFVHHIIVAASYCPYWTILWISSNTMFTHNGIAGNVERTNTDKIRVWEPYGIEGGSSARRSVVY